MQTTAQTTKTAPCGCTFQGRIYSVSDCTVIDAATATGRQVMQHAMKAKRVAK